MGTRARTHTHTHTHTHKQTDCQNPTKIIWCCSFLGSPLDRRHGGNWKVEWEKKNKREEKTVKGKRRQPSAFPPKILRLVFVFRPPSKRRMSGAARHTRLLQYSPRERKKQGKRDLVYSHLWKKTSHYLVNQSTIINRVFLFLSDTLTLNRPDCKSYHVVLHICS